LLHRVLGNYTSTDETDKTKVAQKEEGRKWYRRRGVVSPNDLVLTGLASGVRIIDSE